MELVNDAEPLVRDALLYPLDDTLASGKAQFLLDDGFEEVSSGKGGRRRARQMIPPKSE